MGCFCHAFYRAVGRRKVGGLGEEGNGGGILMVSVTGDGNEEGEEMGCDHFWRWGLHGVGGE
jgi:hypothetical protein